MKTEIKFIGKTKRDKWECLEWRIIINDQIFEWFAGMGHFTPLCKNKPGHALEFNKKPKNSLSVNALDGWVHIPKIEHVLQSLFWDSAAENESFDAWCSNYGYDTDSRKALETYLACQVNATKLRKALGKDYDTKRQEIEAMDL